MTLENTEQYIFGTHVVHELLREKSESVTHIYANKADLKPALRDSIAGYKIPILPFDEKYLRPYMEGSISHQNIAARINLKKIMLDYDTFIAQHTVTDASCFVLLGELHDPQNVGAIIRSAAAFGVSGILFPSHRQVSLTSTVAKVSVGTCFRIPLIQIGNVNNTLEDLKKRGFWTYGLSEDASQSCAEEEFSRPSVFVVGNEAVGIRQKTLEHCDIPLRIPMRTGIDSLNAATATAIMLYAWSLRHESGV